jgi:transposase-like protein
MTGHEVGDRHGITNGTVYNILEDAGIPRRDWSTMSAEAKITRAVISADDVIELRRRYAAGDTLRVLAASYGITAEGCRKVVVGASWSHLPGAMPCRRAAGGPRGARPDARKHDPATRAAIVADYQAGATAAELAAAHDCSHATILVVVKEAGVFEHRLARGESCNGKLTDADVIEIRRRYAAETDSLNTLAEAFGVTQRAVSLAVTGETWAHLPGAMPTRSRGWRRPK